MINTTMKIDCTRRPIAYAAAIRGASAEFRADHAQPRRPYNRIAEIVIGRNETATYGRLLPGSFDYLSAIAPVDVVPA